MSETIKPGKKAVLTYLRELIQITENESLKLDAIKLYIEQVNRRKTRSTKPKPNADLSKLLETNVKP